MQPTHHLIRTLTMSMAWTPKARQCVTNDARANASSALDLDLTAPRLAAMSSPPKIDASKRIGDPRAKHSSKTALQEVHNSDAMRALLGMPAGLFKAPSECEGLSDHGVGGAR